MSNSESEDKKSIKNESESEGNEIEKNNRNKKENYSNGEDDYKSEEDEDFVDEEKEEKKKKKKLIGNKRKRDAKKKKQKKAKTAKSLFLADEAEEDEEEESYGGGEVTREQEAKILKNYDERHFREKNKQMKITDNNVEEIAKRYDEKVIEQQEEDDYYDDIDRRPKSSDPKLWLIKCKVGDEKEILANLYHKYFYFKSKEPKERLKIFSIISYDNLKGKIFVEAFGERDVIYAISGMSNVNQNSIQIIPIEERMQIFEFDKFQKVDICNNQIVRIKHGNYEGDLAKVIYIEDPINKIFIALIPRIYESDSKNNKGFNVAPFSKVRSTLRPRQKIFDENKNQCRIPHIVYDCQAPTQNRIVLHQRPTHRQLKHS